MSGLRRTPTRGDPQDASHSAAQVDAEGSAGGEINEVMIGSRPPSLIGCLLSTARPAH
jgi:hypothetical protein